MIKIKIHQLIRLNQSKRFLTTNILVVGKKNSVKPYIALGCDEYEKRLKPIMSISTSFLKDDQALMDSVNKLNSKSITLALDENGKQMTSKEFSKLIFKSLEGGGSQLNLIIGGFAGLPNEIKKSYKLISLSNLTLTHQMARLFLIEQIYRASEIRKGSNYHKE
jgi:23S rRNA (pseudouridine1915-N3)-methyltransferase